MSFFYYAFCQLHESARLSEACSMPEASLHLCDKNIKLNLCLLELDYSMHGIMISMLFEQRNEHKEAKKTTNESSLKTNKNLRLGKSNSDEEN
jgi:hypothetical protein